MVSKHKHNFIIKKMKKEIFLLLLLLSTFLHAVTYKKIINDKPLIIEATSQEETSTNIIFKSAVHKKGVLLTYDEFKIKTNKAVLNPTSNRIEITNGFFSEVGTVRLLGDNLIFNPEINLFDARNLYFETDSVFIGLSRFSLSNEKMMLQDLKISKGKAVLLDNENLDILNLNDLDIDVLIKKADLYPEWTVIQHPLLKINKVPVLYTPTMIYDYSKAAFDMPTAFPRFGNDIYKGNFWRANLQYYFNEHWFGSGQFGESKIKGGGWGTQHIYRHNAENQFSFWQEQWRWAPTQQKFSYRHSFSRDTSKNKDLYFHKKEFFMTKQALQLLEINYANYEEEGYQYVHKHPEIFFEGDFEIPNSKFTLYNFTYYADIKEPVTDKRGNKAQEINEIKHPIVIDFLKIFPMDIGIGYDSTQYNLDPYYWHQAYYHYGIKYKKGNFFAKAKIRDYQIQEGGSPFEFDSPLIRDDYVKSEYSYKYQKVIFGKISKYAIYNGRVELLSYYLHVYQSAWSARIDYNYKDEAWSIGFNFELF